jgi:hypothetical protein
MGGLLPFNSTSFSLKSLRIKESFVTTIGAVQLPEQLRQKADQLRIHNIRANTQDGRAIIENVKQLLA